VSSSDVAAVTTAPTLRRRSPGAKERAHAIRAQLLDFCRPVPDRAAHLQLCADHLERRSQLLQRSGHGDPDRLRRVRNYTDLFNNGAFTSSLVTFTIFAAFIIPLTFAISLGLALLVNRAKVMQAFFRSVFFIPTACSYVVASLIWKLSIFNGVNFGLANTVLGQFGHSRLPWLTLEHPRGTGFRW